MIEVLSKNNCPNCTIIKNKLTKDGIEFVEVNMNVAEDFERFRELLEETTKLGIREVPQLFFKGKFIGLSNKYDDLISLYESNKNSKNSNSIKYVIKRNGVKEVFDINKIKCNDSINKDILVSYLYNECTTAHIENQIIKMLVDSLNYENNYTASAIVVNRLYNDVYGTTDIPSFDQIYDNLVIKGIWRPMMYSYEDLLEINEFIDHSRDFSLQYLSILQYIKKYAIKNVKTKEIYETPQVTLMGIAMAKMESIKDPVERINAIHDYYNGASEKTLNLPSPIMVGYRTNDDASASCCLIACDDTSDSIEASNHIAAKMTENKAGIGFLYNLRTTDDQIKSGRFTHYGKFPYLKKLFYNVASFSQTSRGGSATVTINYFDPEVIELLNAILPRSPEEKRILHLDYSLAINGYLFDACLADKDIPLFTIYDQPELYKLFYSDKLEEFKIKIEELADKYKKENKKNRLIKAREIYRVFASNSFEMGQTYNCNISNMNHHTPFKYENGDTIMMSNLCQEITLANRPVANILDLHKKIDVNDIEEIYKHGVVSLCILGGIDIYDLYNMGDKQAERLCYLLCLGLDNLIEEMSYPFPLIETTNKAYRPIGIGSLNLAQLLAEHGCNYGSPEGLKLVHEAYEKFYYFLLKASVRLAQERGRCAVFEKTKWADGWTPLETYSRKLDEYVEPIYKYDWKGLSEDIKRYGVRFVTLTAHMPTESSALFTGTNNGVYPTTNNDVYINKDTSFGTIPFFYPKLSSGKRYEYSYNITNENMIKTYAVIQKFCDQSISADRFIDPDKYYVAGTKNPSIRKIFNEDKLANDLGLKTLYYTNLKTGRGESSDMDRIDCAGCKL